MYVSALEGGLGGHWVWVGAPAHPTATILWPRVTCCINAITAPTQPHATIGIVLVFTNNHASNDGKYFELKKKHTIPSHFHEKLTGEGSHRSSLFYLSVYQVVYLLPSICSLLASIFIFQSSPLILYLPSSISYLLSLVVCLLSFYLGAISLI